VLGPAIQSQQPHTTLQALGRVARKLTSGKGPGGVGRQLAEHQPAVCPGGQEGQQHPGFYQEGTFRGNLAQPLYSEQGHL